MRRHGNWLVPQKVLCNVDRHVGGLQVGCIGMPQAVRREIVSHDGRFRVDRAAYHLRAHVEIKRLLERAPHLLHGRFGVWQAGGRLREEIAAVLLHPVQPFSGSVGWALRCCSGRQFNTVQRLLAERLVWDRAKILTLRLSEDLEYVEIAKIMNMTENTCRMQYSRARRHCAELLERQKNTWVFFRNCCYKIECSG